MAGDGEPRAEPWIRVSAHSPDQPPATDAAAEQPRNWWDDVPDPWDRPYHAGGDEEPTSDLHPGGPVEARSDRNTAPRRIAGVVVMVGAVLVGTGFLLTNLQPGREAALTPPPTPPGQAVTGAPESIAGLGRAPTVGPSPGRPGTGSPPPADPPSTRPATAAVTGSYEAEDAEIGLFADAYPREEASGGAAVRMGMLNLGYVSFDDVRVEEAGRYQLTVHYLSEQDSTGLVRVNDGRSVTVEFPGLDLDRPVGTVSIPVDLVAGDNTIVFGPEGMSAPDLDRIDISG
jgi:hypothetical protein